MDSGSTVIGLAVHKQAVVAAVLCTGVGGVRVGDRPPVRWGVGVSEQRIPGEPGSRRRMGRSISLSNPKVYENREAEETT